MYLYLTCSTGRIRDRLKLYDSRRSYSNTPTLQGYFLSGLENVERLRRTRPGKRLHLGMIRIEGYVLKEGKGSISGY